MAVVANVDVTEGPVAVPLPAPPAKDFMTDAQWETLYALLDGVLPSVTSTTSSTVKDKKGSIVLSDTEFEALVDEAVAALSDAPPRHKIKEYLEFRPSLDPSFREDCLRSLASVPQRGLVVTVLRLLGTYAGSFILTGYWTPVTHQPVQARQAILQGWAASRLTGLRSLAKSLTQMAQKANATYSPGFREISGYTDKPGDWRRVEGYDYRFVQVPDGPGIHELTTDVVVVGSGCGGGVCAKNLAEAGHRVLVVDKGYHFPPSQLPMTQAAASHYLYDANGVYFTDTASTGVVCGGAWGGGGTVNWSVCFRLQDFVREEWASRGLPLFTSSEFDDCMDRVWGFIGAGKDQIRHNARNQFLLDGASKLGWRGDAVEQNTAGKEHYCGRCHLGCGSNEKQGPAAAWLPAAGEAGAEFMEGFAVDRVVFADDGVTAVGVEGVWTGRDEHGRLDTPVSARRQRRVVVKAKRVIVSGGSIWSPVILAKSGIQNRNVGRHLHLHPCNLVSAVYGSQDLSSWEGGIITAYINEFENLDGKGHGVKLEPTCNVPFATFALQTWRDGLDAKMLALKYRHLGSWISLTRDRDTGRVYPDARTGGPRIDYTMSDFDRQHTIEGVIALAKVAYVSGATEIRPHLPGLEPYVPSAAEADVDAVHGADDGDEKRKTRAQAQARYKPGTDPEFTDPSFAAWIKRLRAADNKPPVVMCMSAHQMGSCRMSAAEDDGVVDMAGRVWGARNLYVADASVFPSASGVNPMVTAMALADWISRGVAKDLTSV